MASQALPIDPTAFNERITVEAQEIQKIQKEVTTLANNKAKLMEKRNENELVKKELDLLEDDAVVYKMVGPIMATQELVECKTNVEARLKFLEKEISMAKKMQDDFETKAKEAQLKIEKVKEEFKAAC